MATRLGERWLPVTGYEGLYEVSNKGRVQSLDRLVWRRSRKGTLYSWVRPGRIMRQYRSPDSPRRYRRYWQITLTDADGVARHHMVHQLVAREFHGLCPPGKMVCHGPAGMLENAEDNLGYGTGAENQAHRERDGTSNTGARNPGAKLSEESVRQIRARREAGELQKDLAAEYGVSKAAVSMLISGQRWK